MRFSTKIICALFIMDITRYSAKKIMKAIENKKKEKKAEINNLKTKVVYETTFVEA